MSVKWIMSHRFGRLAELVLGVVFLISALSKLRQPYDFLASVYEYEMCGLLSGVAVAVILPWIELGLGCCLLGRVFPTGALLLSSALLPAFIVVQSVAIMRGASISCACFGGSSGETIGFLSLTRTALLFAVALWGVMIHLSGARSPINVDHASHCATQPGGG